MDDVWILGVAHQKLYVYHMRPRVLYPTPNCALLAQLLLFWAGMTSMPAREAAACGERKIAGRGISRSAILSAWHQGQHLRENGNTSLFASLKDPPLQEGELTADQKGNTKRAVYARARFRQAQSNDRLRDRILAEHHGPPERWLSKRLLAALGRCQAKRWWFYGRVHTTGIGGLGKERRKSLPRCRPT